MSLRQLFALGEHIAPQRYPIGSLQLQIGVRQTVGRGNRDVFYKSEPRKTSRETIAPVRDPGGNAEGYMR